MVEVTALVQEGVDLPSIDKAMKAFGMPVGPITLSGTSTSTSTSTSTCVLP
jgi:3-hydroxyacyl-CoA dehydrogenase